MFLKLFLNMFRDRRPLSGILVLILGIVAGPALGQDGWGFAWQPEVAARSAVLMNPATGEVLFAKEPHLPLPPASTTKVLTALVALERLDPNTRVLVSPQAATAPPSRIGLRAGEAALTQDLLYGLMLKSGNDAAEALAEAAGGSIYGFADLMNAKARQIGARNSNFMNPHGLPNDDHYSTAYDLALIFRQAMNHPTFADIVRTRNAALRIESSQGLYGDWRMVPVVNHNRLLGSYEGTLGGKTGYTLKARRCFVGEADRGGVRLIVAILNSPTSSALWQDARTLLDYGFARNGLASPPPAPLAPLPVLVQREPIASPVEEESDEPMVRPEPVTRVAMVRPAPIVRPEPATPVAAIRPAPRVEIESPAPDWQEDIQPVAEESVMPAKPVVTARTRRIADTHTAVKPIAAKPVATPIAKPVVVARPVTRPVVVARPVATPIAKPVVMARPVAKPVLVARPIGTPVAKPVVVARPVATPVAKPVVAARPVATPVAKPVVVAKPAKPLMLAMVAVKPVPTPDKTGKPVMSGKAALVKPAPVAPAKLEKRETAKVAAVRAEPVAKSQKAKR